MTPLVIDSSVVIKWYVLEEYTAEARTILGGFQTRQYTFLAPDFLYAEVGNIVWKKHTQRGLPADEAQHILTSFGRVPFELTSTAALLEDDYQLAVQHQRTVYDMLYVALSRQKRCSFVTADEKLVNSVKNSLENVVWLGNWS